MQRLKELFFKLITGNDSLSFCQREARRIGISNRYATLHICQRRSAQVSDYFLHHLYADGFIRTRRSKWISFVNLKVAFCSWGMVWGISHHEGVDKQISITLLALILSHVRVNKWVISNKTHHVRNCLKLRISVYDFFSNQI